MYKLFNDFKKYKLSLVTKIYYFSNFVMKLFKKSKKKKKRDAMSIKTALFILIDHPYHFYDDYLIYCY